MGNDITTLTLLDENGDEAEFEVITKLDIEEKEYVIVAPKGASEEAEAIILKIDTDDDGNDILYTVEDDEEFDIVSEAYETLFSEGLN